MKNKPTKNLLLIFIILMSTLAIIWTNYIFNKQVSLDISKTMEQNEYNKIWWKDNYTLLKEIQKREILSYIDKIKKEQPELVYKIRQEANKNPNKKFLSWENMNILKKNSIIEWNSWSNITITEFSDMECPYCIKQHNDWTIQNILKSNSGSINYIFKNFPLPKHKNSEKEAIAAICIWKISSQENYFTFIDNIFKNTTGWWEWYDLNNLPIEIEKLGINKKEFNSCYTDEKSRKLVVDEFNLWIKLWVNSTPTSFIINNQTGEYKLLKWKVWESDFSKAISELK